MNNEDIDRLYPHIPAGKPREDYAKAIDKAAKALADEIDQEIIEELSIEQR